MDFSFFSKIDLESKHEMDLEKKIHISTIFSSQTLGTNKLEGATTLSMTTLSIMTLSIMTFTIQK